VRDRLGPSSARRRWALAIESFCPSSGREGETAIQITWIRDRMKEAAPQAPVVAS
jgi:hypothetical protein